MSCIGVCAGKKSGGKGGGGGEEGSIFLNVRLTERFDVNQPFFFYLRK